jgi:hypothetical protein
MFDLLAWLVVGGWVEPKVTFPSQSFFYIFYRLFCEFFVLVFLCWTGSVGLQGSSQGLSCSLLP